MVNLERKVYRWITWKEVNIKGQTKSRATSQRSFQHGGPWRVNTRGRQTLAQVVVTHHPKIEGQLLEPMSFWPWKIFEQRLEGLGRGT